MTNISNFGLEGLNEFTNIYKKISEEAKSDSPAKKLFLDPTHEGLANLGADCVSSNMLKDDEI